MNTLQLRQRIIDHIRDRFESDPRILAYWLGGSDANNESDEYSDLDLFFGVDDGHEEVILQEIKKELAVFGSFDYEEDISHHTKKVAQTVHIAGTSEHLLIEMSVLSKSEGMVFAQWHPAFKPKIIFDKAGFIRFVPHDPVELKKRIRIQLTEQKNLMHESGRALKYIERGEYIEATNYYIKYVFLPLVSVLRIKHTPPLHDWLRIHISRQLPAETVVRLESLMKFNSFDDLTEHIRVAREWFWEVVAEIETPTIEEKQK